MNLAFIRREDYWIYPLSFVGILFTGAMLYVGVMQMRLILGLFGFSIFFFLTHIVRKNYSKQHAARYLLAYLVISILLALGGYFLTN